MKKILEIEPLDQTGHNCKITAIAIADNYFGTKLGFRPIPLHKQKKESVSIRELSKTRGSIQGELLEIRQISEIFTALNYETDVVNVQNNYELFKKVIIDNIHAGNLLMVFFAVNRFTGQPSLSYDQGSRYLVIDFSHPWPKSTRQRAKCLAATVLRPARCPERASVCLPQ